METNNGIVYIPRTYVNNYWHDMLYGPCECGAWHKGETWLLVIGPRS